MATSRDFPAALFDFNGVLVDDEHVHLAAFRDVLRSLDIEVSDEAYRERYLGFDDVGAFRAILRDASEAKGRPREPTPEEIQALVEAKKPRYLERARRQLSTFPGAAAVIGERAAVGPVGIVSGALRGEIELGLEVLGVRHLVSFVVSAEDTAACKPDPEGYLAGIAQLTERIGPVAARQALVFEDSLAGIQSASRAGLHCVAVAHSYPREQLLEAGARWAVSRLEELGGEVLRGYWRELTA